jgi:(4S)-4-hydroxy-5-phosphonooxypentane-2,3-dione isomerase
VATLRESGGVCLMYGTLMRIVVKTGMRSELLEYLRWDAQVAKDSEPGTLRFDVWEVEGESNVVYLYEAYKDMEAFENHKKNDPYKKWGEFVSMMEQITDVIPFAESIASNVNE